MPRGSTGALGLITYAVTPTHPPTHPQPHTHLALAIHTELSAGPAQGAGALVARVGAALCEPGVGAANRAPVEPAALQDGRQMHASRVCVWYSEGHVQ